MSKKSIGNKSQRAPVGSSKTDWFAHIRALGLKSVAKYEDWCRRHGQPFHRRKSWRQERQERRIAERERVEDVLCKHIQSLGLASEEAYLAWCQEHGFSVSTAKNLRKLQGEIQYWRKRERAPVTALVPTVGRQHLARLGVPSQEAYRAWCKSHGLNPSIAKGPKEMENEVAVATLAASKQQRLGTRALIERIHARTVAAYELKTVVLQRIHAGFATLDGACREAGLHLLLHTEGCSELLSTAPGAMRWGRRPGNSFVEGLFALARQQAAWIRTVDGWRPESRIHYEQFASLARYLVAEYDVPALMDSVWFSEDGKAARRQQRWFVHVGQGGDIRRADVPIELSKKMAHEFYFAPEHYTVEEALRYGQVRGQGGSPNLAEAVIATHLGRVFDHDEFWSKVVQFFVHHPELELKWVAPIVAYIHHRKFEPLGGGDPAEPNFAMKSRSVPKLLDQVERWQKQWTREAKANLERKTDAPRVRYNPYHAEDSDKWGNALCWTIEELTSSGALAAEGEAMNHCVGRWGNKLDQLSIWSLKVQEGDRVYHVLTVSIDLAEGYVTEVRGRFNLSPHPGGENRGRSKGKLSKRENRFLGAANDHLQTWLAREGLADVQVSDGDAAERQDFWDWHQWQARIGAAVEPAAEV